MGHKPEATSIPPNTDEIDSDWNETSAVLDAEPERPTAVPSDYERYATEASRGDMSDEDARRALSAPGMPLIDIDEVDELLGLQTRDSGELEASVPMLGQQPSGPYEIPLELGEDGEEVHPSERPTTPQLEPPPGFASTPTPKIEPPESGRWGDEAPTPAGTFPEALRALRKLSSPRRPAIRAGRPVEAPEVTFTETTMEELGLDEPGPINMEDSLELSIGDVPPAPFDLPPSTEGQSAKAKAPLEDLEFSLDTSSDALGLVDARATPVVPDPDDPLIDLRDRYAVGDFTGANEIAEAILAEDPHNDEALRFRESCRDVLTQMYTARLGSTAKVPRLAIPTAELQWLSLDHRAGFLLSCVDGRSTIEEILDVSGMPALDALRILYTLLQQQIIEVVD